MLWLISSSVRLRTLVVAVAAGLLILGVVSIREKSLEVIPELALPSLTVKTESLGLSSAEVESLITVPLEADLLNGVPWLQLIQSESMAGISTIEMIFAPGTDLMKARQMVQERLTQAHALPNVSSPPVMLQPVSSTSRVMNIGLSSKSVSLIDMSIQARWNIAPRLAGVPGVANVSIWGQRERQVQVLVDGRNLLKRGVKLEQVIKTTGEAVWSSPLTYLNSSTPGTGGFIETPNQRLSIRHQLPISTVGTFAKVPLSGTTVRVGDVAFLAEGHQALIGDAIIGDGPGLMLAIEKFPGFNTSDVTRGVERALDELKPGLPGIEINTTIYHPASFIERATRNLSKAAAISVVLVAAALGLLMRSWRSAVIAMAAISLSFISAALLLQAAGISLSMMVIGGLLMASGVVVHDGILDADNLLRRLRAARDGQSNFMVLARAMLETRRPMVYASLIVVLAVLPVLFMQSRSAAFFAPMAWAYIAAVSVSMLVALILTPALAALLLANATLDARVDEPIDRLAGIFDRVAGPVTRWPIAGIGVGVAAAIASFALITPLERNMVPSFKETDLLIEWQGPPGTSLQAMMRSTEGLIQDLKQIPGVQNAHANLGRALLCNCERATDVNTGHVWVNIDPKAHYETVVDAVEAAVTAYPGMRGQVGTYLSTRLREALTGDPDSITVRVYGKSLDVIRAKAEEIRAAIAKISGIENARVELQVEEPAIEVKVDVDRAADFGLKPGDVRRATSALVGGITVGALFEEQKVFDVVVWGRPELRDNIEDIRNLMINSENGSQARLDQVADVRVAPATSIIRRQGASRRIDVLAKVDERALGDVADEVARAVKQVAFPFEHRAEVLGEYREQRASLRSIYGYVAAAAIVMFLLMQAVLRSWKLSALSVLGVPIAMLGGVAMIPITEEGTFSLGSLLGLVAVLALAVRQGIGLVAHLQHLQLDEGEPFGEALVRRGVREQLPSIMASSIATIVLVLPFAMMGDVAGLEIAHPLAVVVLGGVVTATLGTLLVLPALYVRFAADWTRDRLDLDLGSAS
ncbi:efflux RND transporter permease subunit [Bradyrhizobium sp. B117]|uniref:efflux RND transporter permease subunit n=1 Tax=Bradyrhizobium sp. B117 TaxID=3140246 RepID=UPI003182FB62